MLTHCKTLGCGQWAKPDSKYCEDCYEENMAKWDLSKLDRKSVDVTVMDNPQTEYIKTTDNVNHPSHYGQGNIEAIEYISDFLTKEEYQGYLRGNIAKYLHRWPYKNKLEDLKKASWYLNRLIKEMEN